MRKQNRKLITYSVGFILISMFSILIAYAADCEIDVKASRGTEKNSVVIEWSSVESATGYHIMKSKNYNGIYVPAGWRDSGETSYVDYDVSGGEYYWYKVKPQFHLLPGTPTKRVQGWIKPQMSGGMIETSETIARMVNRAPHIRRVRDLARKRQESLPAPDLSAFTIPDKGRMMNWIRGVCKPDHRRIGSPESRRSIEYIKAELHNILGTEVIDEAIALDDVYTAEDWGLEIISEGKYEKIDSFYAVNTGMTLEENPNGGVATGKMVWAGSGSPDEFIELDKAGKIKGRIVVATCEFPDLPLGVLDILYDGHYYTSDPENWINPATSYPMTFARSNFPAEYTDERYEDSVYWQAYNRGAAGLVLILKNHPGKTNTHWGPYDGKMERPIPCMWVSSYEEAKMQTLAQNEEMAKITLTGTVEPGEGHNIYTVLEGNGSSDEIILITTHHDSSHKGATEDGSGIAMVLAQAEIWKNIDKSERNKTIVFCFSDGHFYAGVGAKTFAERHPEIMKKTIININLEHLAAKRVEDVNGEFVPQEDSGAFTCIFVNESPTAISTTARMLDRVRPYRTIEMHSTMFGDVPPGESGHYHIASGVDFIHWIGSPVYLLTAEDTEDKVDENMLEPLAGGVTELVATYMLLPEGHSDYE